MNNIKIVPQQNVRQKFFLLIFFYSKRKKDKRERQRERELAIQG